MAYVLGIDIGSTSIKALVYDASGKLAASAYRKNEVVYLDDENPEWAFWNPEVIWQHVIDLIQQVVHQIDNPNEVQALSVTGMGADGLPVDQNGEVLYPIISWHCQRTREICSRWQTRSMKEKIFSLTGHQAVAYDTVYRLIWFREHKPELMEKTWKWLLIEDYINFRLCGRMVTDYSLASSTGLFDLRQMVWSDELLEAAGIDKYILPQLQPSGANLGCVLPEIALKTGLSTKTQVILGGHDYHCAALAVGATQLGVIMDITGTFEIVSAATVDLKLGMDYLDAGVTIEGHVAKNAYNMMAFNLSADMLEWFRSCLSCAEAPGRDDQDWSSFMGEAEKSPCGAKGIFFLPHFSGCFSPVVDSCSQGAYIGLTKCTGKGDLLRAMIEGLNYQFREMVDTLTGAMGIEIEKVIAVGGATKNHFWMQNKADVLGKVVEVPDIQEATGLGAAILAGIGSGIYADEQDAYLKTYQKGKSYSPNENHHQAYNAFYRIYQMLYPTLKDIHHRMIDTNKKVHEKLVRQSCSVHND